MKRISTVIVVLLAVLLVVPNAKAQEQDYAHQKGLTIGVNGAALLTGIVVQPSWGQANYNHQARFGYNVGLDLGYQFARQFSVSVGLGLQNLGTTLNNKSYYLDELNKPLNVDRKIDMQYLNIPVMLRFVDNRQTFNFVGGVGLSYSMLMSADQTWTVENTANGNTVDYSAMVEVDGKMVEVAEKDVKDRFKSGDIVVNLEAGVRLCATKKLNFDLVTYYGLGVQTAVKSEWNKVKNFIPEDYITKKPHNIYGGFRFNVSYRLGK